VCKARNSAGLPDPYTTETRARLARPSVGVTQRRWRETRRPGVMRDKASFAPIAGGLTLVTVTAIVPVTGLSKSYTASVRKGECVPHPRHWPALATLARVPCPFDETISGVRSPRPGGMRLSPWNTSGGLRTARAPRSGEGLPSRIHDTERGSPRWPQAETRLRDLRPRGGSFRQSTTETAKGARLAKQMGSPGRGREPHPRSCLPHVRAR
jgi:hypothetical protein